MQSEFLSVYVYVRTCVHSPVYFFFNIRGKVEQDFVRLGSLGMRLDDHGQISLVTNVLTIRLLISNPDHANPLHTEHHTHLVPECIAACSPPIKKIKAA